MNEILRREFIALASGAGAVGVFSGCLSPSTSESKPLFGACCASGGVSTLRDAGYDFWEGGACQIFNPDMDDKWWLEQRAKIMATPLPLRSCNGFIPGKFRLTGPDASFEAPLAFAKKICDRADEVGVVTIVLGSGGARNAPEGYPIDKAVAEFTEFCKRLADKIQSNRVTVVLEPLQPKEANYLNFVTQGYELVEKIGSPRIQCLADIFHMMQGGESAESIVKAGGRIKHVHIAEVNTRQYPGKDRCDFSPYFAALRKIGYCGGISCECGWPGERNERVAAYKAALDFMKSEYAKNIAF